METDDDWSRIYVGITQYVQDSHFDIRTQGAFDALFGRLQRREKYIIWLEKKLNEHNIDYELPKPKRKRLYKEGLAG